MADNQRNNAAPPPAAPPAPPATTGAGNRNHKPVKAQATRPSWSCDCLALVIVVAIVVAAIVAFILHATGHSNLLHINGHSSQSEQSTLRGGPILYVESISPFKLSDSQITSNWDVIAIRVANNGTSELHYDNVQVYVRCKGQLLSRTAVGPINVAPKEYTTFQARLGASQNIDNQVVASVIKDHKTQEAVDFNVELKATHIRLGGRKYVQDGKSTSVICGDIKVDTKTWTMLGGPSACKVQV